MSDFTFVPVNVSRGRKFKGFGYLLEGGYTYVRGYHGSGVDPYQATEYAKIWDPIAKRVAYANALFCVKMDLPEDEVAAAKAAYISETIQSTIAWCREKKAGSPEPKIKQFARNVLRKHHPEMLEEIDAAISDQRDVVSEVQKTLQWAMNLKTQPCIIYGHHCPGGKLLPEKKKLEIAKKSLEKKGISKLDGFIDAWKMNVTLMGLANFDS